MSGFPCPHGTVFQRLWAECPHGIEENPGEWVRWMCDQRRKRALFGLVPLSIIMEALVKHLPDASAARDDSADDLPPDVPDYPALRRHHQTLREAMVLRALKQTDGNLTEACRQINMNRRQMYRVVNEMLAAGRTVPGREHREWEGTI